MRHPRPVASKLRLNRKACTLHQDHNSKRLLAQLLQMKRQDWTAYAQVVLVKFCSSQLRRTQQLGGAAFAQLTRLPVSPANHCPCSAVDPCQQLTSSAEGQMTSRHAAAQHAVSWASASSDSIFSQEAGQQILRRHDCSFWKSHIPAKGSYNRAMQSSQRYQRQLQPCSSKPSFSLCIDGCKRGAGMVCSNWCMEIS